MTSHTQRLPRISTRTCFFVALAALVVVFAAYVVLINKTVMNVVARERMQKQVASLSTSMGDLEFQYITLKNKVTLDLAYERGFEDASPSSFLTRSKGIPSLSYNNPR